MLNPTEVLADALGNKLAAAYARAFSGREPRYTEVIAEATRLILERIGRAMPSIIPPSIPPWSRSWVRTSCAASASVAT